MKKIINLFKQDSNKFFFLLAGIIIVFFLAELTYYTFFLDTWFDEANFSYKSWLTSQNMAQPFQDFRSKFGPVAFYSQLALQGLFGPTLLGARILSALFLIGMLLLIFSICKKMGNKWLGLIGASLLIFHPYLVGNYISVLPFSLAMFFMLASVWFFNLRKISATNKIILASLAMSLAVLVRYNLFPALIALWIFVFFYWRNWKYLIISLVTSLAAIFIIFIPYALLDFKYALTWFFMMLGPLAKILPADYFDYFQMPNEYTAGNISQSFLSFLSANRLKGLINLFTKYFYILAIFISGLFMILAQKKANLKNFFTQNSILVFVFALAVFLFAVHTLGFRTQLIYSLHFMPFLIISATGVIGLFYQQLAEKNIWSYVNKYLIIFLVFSILLTTVSTALSGSYIIFFNHFDYQDSDLNRIKKGADYLKSVTSHNDVILTIDDPHTFLMAGRYVIPPLINKHYTYADIEDVQFLDRYAFYNFAMFLNWLENRADVVVIQRGSVEDRIGIRMGAKERTPEFNEILADKYDLVGSAENVYPKKYTRGLGIMDVYRRKEAGQADN